MKKRIALLVVICLTALSVTCAAPEGTDGADSAPETAGTSQSTPDTDSAHLPYTFTDDLGRSVTVHSADRVAALLGSYADMWLLAGGNVCAAVEDAWDDFALPLPEDTVNLGALNKPDTEALLGAEPDLVLASSKLRKHLGMREALEGAGITVAYLDVSDFTSYLAVLKTMTDITGNAGSYEKYGLAQKEKIDDILASHSGDGARTVLVMRASAASIRAKNSEDTMLGAMLRDFGCVNIADSDSMLLDNLSVESILEKDPDMIFFVQAGDDPDAVKRAAEDMFAANPLWKELGAVRDGRVYYMDKRLYNMKPNARYAEAYEKLERILYEK